MLLIISGPSGVGKSTLITHLLQKFPSLRLSVSHTTRSPRKGEVDREHYYFVSEERFKEMIEEEAFIEHEHVYGNHYGTSLGQIADIQAAGLIPLFDVDTRGGKNLIARYPEATSIFIMPPSFVTLRDRILGRGTETPESFSMRIRKITAQCDGYEQYRFVVFNDELVQAQVEMESIIRAELCRTATIRPRVDAVIASFKNQIDREIADQEATI